MLGGDSIAGVLDNVVAHDLHHGQLRLCCALAGRVHAQGHFRGRVLGKGWGRGQERPLSTTQQLLIFEYSSANVVGSMPLAVSLWWSRDQTWSPGAQLVMVGCTHLPLKHMLAVGAVQQATPRA